MGRLAAFIRLWSFLVEGFSCLWIGLLSVFSCFHFPSWSHINAQANAASHCVKAIQANQVQTCLYDMHGIIIDMRKGREHNRSLLAKSRAVVCYFCLPVGLHVCDKRERPSYVFTQCVVPKCVPCFCTVCVHVCECLSAIKQSGLPVSEFE